MGKVFHLRERPTKAVAVQLNWRNWSEICELLVGVIGETNPGKVTNNYFDTCGEEGPYIEVGVPVSDFRKFAPVRHGQWILIINGSRQYFILNHLRDIDDEWEVVDEDV